VLSVLNLQSQVHLRQHAIRVVMMAVMEMRQHIKRDYESPSVWSISFSNAFFDGAHHDFALILPNR
jgi:hypothetical protein